MIARGATVIVSSGSGVSRKPRPAIVIQAADFDFPETVIVVPLTGQLVDDNMIMPLLTPDPQNGIEGVSRAMIHRMGAVRKSDIGRVIGNLSREDIEKVDMALSLVLGLNAN